jgi:hypothetical protein
MNGQVGQLLLNAVIGILQSLLITLLLQRCFYLSSIQLLEILKTNSFYIYKSAFFGTKSVGSINIWSVNGE